jgi:GNAT superfamily N-acetyltransferase
MGVINVLTAADADAAAALSAGFGWPHRPVDWELLLRIGRGFGLRENGVVVATALWYPLGPDHASIGSVQVAPHLQGQGIGRKLMDAVIQDSAPRRLMLHATAEGAGLYAKLGFRAAGTLQQWQGLYAGATPGSGAVRPAVAADRSAITALDAASRAARDDVLDAWMDGATVAVHGAPGAVNGYAMRRSFGRGQLIGPVVASDESVALALITFLAVPGFLRIDIPADAAALQAWCLAWHLRSVGDVQLMLRGDWPVPGPVRVWSPATQATG